MKLEKRASFGWPATAAGYAPCLNGLVVHYDGSRQNLAAKDHSACQLYWRNTRRFHMSSARGWADIGYAYGLCPHGIVMEGRGWQRAQAAQPGGNTTWTSVTFMSGDGEEPPEVQLNAFKEFRAWLRGKGLGAAVRGHRDFISTSCPGGVLYQMVKSGALLGAPEQEDDMPLSKDDLEAIRKIVWDSDQAPVPPGVEPGDNPAWRYVNLLRETYGRAVETKALVAALAGQAPDVDEDAIVAGVLAGLTPERIAAAIPAELGDQVVDAITRRLEQ